MRHTHKFAAALLFTVLLLLCTGCGILSAQPVAAGQTNDTRLYLVSTGNGDPDNITLKAVDVISRSDIIFCHERTRAKFPELLAGKAIYDPGFGIFAIHGKTPEEGRKSTRFDYDEKMAQLKEISNIIRGAVAEGKTVSVLCSGDPTIYGPNMWYMAEFADLNPEIITGVSAFNSCNAALKRGVTSGKNTHSVILTATFGREGIYEGTDSIENLARIQATMAFFTMFMDMDAVVEKLRVHYPADTPVAIVQHAGYKDREKVIYGTLETIKDKIKEDPPFEYMMYVGDFMSKR